ncbi:hypothetical protein [Aurantimonas endophytica]|uniref:Uncharacterized protein n=1 Tax=Aurantimonas endophytica TaxID=1522175 RepID=A0A7W6HIM2_9HYPH|nr:hypothetical protein [Aurantimonas endophytica]MBB4005653.1 hypothetical protein [Aurantimonas endophytica]MCO6406395.1 hypothetical protein [Aurantimonas endophytica]
MIATLLLVLVAPHVDSAIAAWAQRKERAGSGSGSLLPAALRRMARFAFLSLVIVLLGYEWALPGLTALEVDVSVIRAKALQIGLVVLVGAFLWNVVAVAVRRLDRREHQVPGAEGHAPPGSYATGDPASASRRLGQDRHPDPVGPYHSPDS